MLPAAASRRQGSPRGAGARRYCRASRAASSRAQTEEIGNLALTHARRGARGTGRSRARGRRRRVRQHDRRSRAETRGDQQRELLKRGEVLRGVSAQPWEAFRRLPLTSMLFTATRGAGLDRPSQSSLRTKPQGHSASGNAVAGVPGAHASPRAPRRRPAHSSSHGSSEMRSGTALLQHQLTLIAAVQSFKASVNVTVISCLGEDLRQVSVVHETTCSEQ